jgi:hypothetical protein
MEAAPQMMPWPRRSGSGFRPKGSSLMANGESPSRMKASGLGGTYCQKLQTANARAQPERKLPAARQWA